MVWGGPGQLGHIGSPFNIAKQTATQAPFAISPINLLGSEQSLNQAIYANGSSTLRDAIV